VWRWNARILLRTWSDGVRPHHQHSQPTSISSYSKCASYAHCAKPAVRYIANTHFCMLTGQCAFRINCAHQPRFPIGIQDRSFELAIEHLKRLEYNGPLGLACNDTKLLPALRPYYNKATDKHYVLGSTGEPSILADPDKLKAVLERGEAEKASKVGFISLLARQSSLEIVGSPMVSSGAFTWHSDHCGCWVSNTEQSHRP
jgi:hypothetical protein